MIINTFKTKMSKRCTFVLNLIKHVNKPVLDFTFVLPIY